MCVFCAAIPVAAAVGAKTRVKQQQEARSAENQPAGKRKLVIPAGPATAVVIAGLAIGSITVHTHQFGL